MIGVVGLGVFFAVGTEVARRSAAIEVTDRDLTIVEGAHGTNLSLVFERARLTAIGVRPSIGPSWQITPRGVRRQLQWSLRVVAGDQAIDLLTSFSRADLVWIEGFIRQAWRVPDPPDGVGVRHLSAGRARLFKQAYSILSIAMMVFYGCLVLGFLVRGLAPGLASRNWPSTTGRVITARYQVLGRGSHRSYHADASYRFMVDGVERRGNKVAFGYQAGEPAIRALVEGLEPGDTVAVYYDPANPQRSVLYPGVEAERVWLLPIGMLMFAMGYWQWQGRRRYLRDVAPIPGVKIVGPA